MSSRAILSPVTRSSFASKGQQSQDRANEDDEIIDLNSSTVSIRSNRNSLSTTTTIDDENVLFFSPMTISPATSNSSTTGHSDTPRPKVSSRTSSLSGVRCNLFGEASSSITTYEESSTNYNGCTNGGSATIDGQCMKCVALTKQRDELKVTVTNLQLDVKEFEKQLKKVSQVSEKNCRDFETKSIRLRETLAHVERVEGAKQIAIQSQSKLNDKILQLQSINQNLTEQMAQATAQLNHWQSLHSHHLALIDSMKAEIDALKSHRPSLNGSPIAKSVPANPVSPTRDIEELTMTNEILRAEHLNALTNIRMAEEKQLQLEAQLSETTQQLSVYMAKDKESRSKTDAAVMSVKKLFDAKLAEKEEILRRTLDKLKLAQENIPDSVSNELRGLKQQLEALSSEIIQKDTKLSDLQRKNNELHENVRMLFNKHKKDLETLRNEYQSGEFERRYEDLVRKNEELENMVALLEESMVDSEKVVTLCQALKADIMKTHAMLLNKVTSASRQDELERLVASLTERCQSLDEQLALQNRNQSQPSQHSFEVSTPPRARTPARPAKTPDRSLDEWHDAKTFQFGASPGRLLMSPANSMRLSEFDVTKQLELQKMHAQLLRSQLVAMDKRYNDTAEFESAEREVLELRIQELEQQVVGLSQDLEDREERLLQREDDLIALKLQLEETERLLIAVESNNKSLVEVPETNVSKSVGTDTSDISTNRTSTVSNSRTSTASRVRPLTPKRAALKDSGTRDIPEEMSGIDSDDEGSEDAEDGEGTRNSCSGIGSEHCVENHDDDEEYSEEEMETLLEQLNASQQRTQWLASEVAKNDQLITELGQELTKSDEMLEALESENELLRKQLQLLQSGHHCSGDCEHKVLQQQTTQAFALAQTTISQLDEQIAQQNVLRTQRDGEMAQLEFDFHNQQQTLNRVMKEYELLCLQNQHLTEAVAAKTAEVERLSVALAQTQNQTQAESQIEEFQKQIEVFQKQLEVCSGQLAAKQSVCNQLVERIEDLSRQLKSSQNHVREATVASKLHQQESRTLESKLRKAENRVHTLEKECSQLQSKIGLLLSLGDGVSDTTTFKNVLELEKQVGALTSELEFQKNESSIAHGEFQVQYNQMEQQINALHEQNDVLTVSLATCRQHLVQEA